MKNYTSYVIDSILAVCIIILFALFVKSKKVETKQPICRNADGQPINIVYVDTTIIKEYNLAKELNEILTKKQGESKAQVDAKAKKWENDKIKFESSKEKFAKEYQSFEKKIQTNAFLSEDRARQEGQRLEQEYQRLGQEELRLAQEQQSIQILEAELAQNLMIENQQMNNRLNDSIMNAINIYKEKYDIDFVLNEDFSSLLYGKPEYNISKEIIDILNSRYSK